MSAHTLLANFGTIVESPDGVARARTLILDLATLGRLTVRIPNDDQRRSSDDSRLDELPPGWRWVPLESTGRLVTGTSANSLAKERLASVRSGVPYVATKDVGYGNEEIRYDTGLLVPEDCLEYKRARPGAVLLCLEGGSAGRKMGITDRTICFGNKLLANETYDDVDPTYLLYCYLSTRFQTEFRRRKTGIIGGISKKAVAEIEIALPPIDEQHFIVAKVAELMRLCDRLEAGQALRQHAATRLRESSLMALIAAENQESLSAAWSRLRANWNAVTNASNAIDSLRQTVLQLAVRGRLVPRGETSTGTAGELVEATRERRKQVEHERGLRQPKNLTEISEVAKPFDLPTGWAWARFSELGELARGRSQHRPRNDLTLYVNGAVPLIQTGDVARAVGTIQTWSTTYNEKGLAQSRLWPAGTLCITIAANIADSALLGFDACFPDSVVGFVPFKPIPDARYFEYFMRTAQSYLEQFAPSTAQKNINLAILDELLIPLPPAEEMHRIVQRVEALLGLCDVLEARQMNSDTASAELTGSLLQAIAS